MNVIYVLFRSKSNFLDKGRTNYQKVLHFLQNFTSNHGLAITHNVKGKPRLNTDLINFSVSHKGKKFLLVFAFGIELGVDLEEDNSIKRIDSLAKRFFSKDEYVLIKNSSEPTRLFYHFWTQKEAIYKLQQKEVFLQVLKKEVSYYEKQIRLLPLSFSNYSNQGRELLATVAFYQKNQSRMKIHYI